MEAPDCSEAEKAAAEPTGDAENAENPDLEDGEIEDDDDEEETVPDEPEKIAETKTSVASQILPAAVPTDISLFASTKLDKEAATKRHAVDRKGDKHLTEAEKCVRMLHKMEREARERRERDRRREQVSDDWAGNVEKAIASVLKKDRHSDSPEEEVEEEKKRGRKRKKKERERKKKHRKTETSPKEEIDEDEMLNVRGGSPEGKIEKEPVVPAFAENEQLDFESFDSEYDSESYSHRQTKRNFERDRKRDRNRNREQRRDRKNFRDKNNRKKEEQRPQLQDANSICMFYMQGKCHKGEECPYSHDALPPMKLELCKFYLMECCAKRDKCLYMHSEFPCKYYHTGLKCFAQDNCKFAHGKPLSDSLRQVLMKHLETAPKEILGEFPRLSREGAQHMVNQTQKNLEVQLGIKPVQSQNNQNDKINIPSLFDITVSMPFELMPPAAIGTNAENTEAENKKKSSSDSSPVVTKDKKVRQTRWNDEPPVVPMLPVLNQAFAGNVQNAGVQNMFPQLNLQDQQKLQEYQMHFQMKGFYSEQDQDMRINSNGDVDMRTLPQIIPKQPEQHINFEQYRHDANLNAKLTSNSTSSLNSNASDTQNVVELSKMDVDIRNFSGSDYSLNIAEDKDILSSTTTSKSDLTSSVSSTSLKKDIYDVPSDSSLHKSDNDLTIDEKADLPSNMPKKQRELYLRIQAQQKENPPEKEENNDTPINNDDDWYSSDDDNDPLSKMVIHLEDEENPIRIENDKETTEANKKQSDKIFSPPLITMKPVEVFDKLGDLSKIDISDEVTKLLQTIQGNTNPNVSSSNSSTSSLAIQPTSSIAPDPTKRRDPRQAKLLDAEITSTSSSTAINAHTDPRMPPKSATGSGSTAACNQTTSASSSATVTVARPERRVSSSHRITIYEQGIINPEEKKSIYEQADKLGIDTGSIGKSDVDLRNLGALGSLEASKDLDMRQSFGDTDLRHQTIGRQDVDLRQLSLPFKAIQNYTPATEIDASIGSHSPIAYKVHVVDIPRPDYTGLKLNAQDAQVTSDPRLRKIFRVPSIDERDSPASPKQTTSPPKPARQDPRRRNLTSDPETNSLPKLDQANLSYNQQLQILQNSPFYQTLTSNQKLMLNQEIASKGDQNTQNDPILNSILSSLGLITNASANTSNGSAMNILNHVNSMVPNMNPNLGQNMPQNMSQNMPGLGQNMGANIGMGQNIAMPQNLAQIGSNLGPMGQNMPPNVALGQNMPGIIPNLGPGLLGAGPGITGINMGQNIAPNMGQNMSQNLGPNMPQNLGPNMGQGLGQNMGQGLGPGQNMGQVLGPGQNMGQGLGQNMGQGIGQNMGQGLGQNMAQGMGQNMGQNEFPINFDPRNGGLLGAAPFQSFPEGQNFQYNDEFYPNSDENNCNFAGNNFSSNNQRERSNNFRGERNTNRRGGRNWNNRHNNTNRSYNRNNRNNRENRDRSNRSYTPP